MYQLLTSHVKTTTRRGRWREEDVADLPVVNLTALYDDVIFVITYPALPSVDDKVYFRLSDITPMLSGVSATRTVTQWLADLGNKTLPTTPGEPDFTERHVHYINAWHGGYHAEPVNRGEHEDATGSKYTKKDLLLTHPDINPETLRKNALFSVNGFFHMAEYGERGVYLHDGNTTVLKSNDNQIGIHSFYNVGEVEYLPITDDMVTNLREGELLANGVYVTLPEELDFKSTTILLVIGGFLQVLDKTYTRVGRRTYRVELNKLMLLERYYETHTKLDLKGFSFTKYEKNPDLISINEWFSDAAIMTLLRLSQTFFVVVKTPSMFEERIPVESLPFPGRFMDNEYRHFPMIGTYGKALEYHAVEESGLYKFAAMNNIRHAYAFQRYAWLDQGAFDDSRDSYRPFIHDHAYWRVMGSQET